MVEFDPQTSKLESIIFIYYSMLLVFYLKLFSVKVDVQKLAIKSLSISRYFASFLLFDIVL